MIHHALNRTALAFLTLFALALAVPAAAADPVGSVTRVQGTVTLEATAVSRAVSKDDPVNVGDTLVTTEDARVEITMKDGTVLTLSGDTGFTISQFDQDKGVARLDMLRGAFRAVTGGITKLSSPDFQVTTPLATIGIRGTDFWGGFFKADKLDVFMISGHEVYIENAAGRQVITRPGDGVTVPAPGVAPTAPITWGKQKVQRAIKTITFD